MIEIFGIEMTVRTAKFLLFVATIVCVIGAITSFGLMEYAQKKFRYSTAYYSCVALIVFLIGFLLFSAIGGCI